MRKSRSARLALLPLGFAAILVGCDNPKAPSAPAGPTAPSGTAGADLSKIEKPATAPNEGKGKTGGQSAAPVAAD